MEESNIDEIVKFFKENGTLTLFDLEDEDIRFIFTHYPSQWQNSILSESIRLLSGGKSIFEVIQSTFVLGIILGYKCWKQEFSEINFRLDDGNNNDEVKDG